MYSRHATTEQLVRPVSYCKYLEFQFTIVKLYDVPGREVATLMNGVKEPGTYTVQFYARLSGLPAGQAGGQGSHLSSGVYFYRLETGAFPAVKEMLVLR